MVLLAIVLHSSLTTRVCKTPATLSLPSELPEMGPLPPVLSDRPRAQPLLRGQGTQIKVTACILRDESEVLLKKSRAMPRDSLVLFSLILMLILPCFS